MENPEVTNNDKDLLISIYYSSDGKNWIDTEAPIRNYYSVVFSNKTIVAITAGGSVFVASLTI